MELPTEFYSEFRKALPTELFREFHELPAEFGKKFQTELPLELPTELHMELLIEFCNYAIFSNHIAEKQLS